MEQIEIKGFLSISHAVFEIKKINILIGAQAQGKSVIAKLVFFFKSFFSEYFLESIKNLESKNQLDARCLEHFEQFFPSYAWSNQEFSITYTNNDFEISITHKKIAKKYSLKQSYSKNLLSLHNKLKRNYQAALSEIEKQEVNSFLKDMQKVIEFQIILANIPFFSNEVTFIPAGRSFFAHLQKNIFSLLSSNIDIDPFMNEFGSYYERAKRIYAKTIVDNFAADDKIIWDKIDELIQKIIVGEYSYIEDQDWILHEGRRTNLANASSGQQESLPMLLILRIWPFLYSEKRSSTFFIEEPEAHLFPNSQKQIISLISTIYNAFGHAFFITTHSPYILTAINNLVVGYDAYEKAQGNPEQLAELEQVLPNNELIRLSDVSAYTLNHGKLESIIDLENRLIGANLLDSVSDEFDRAFGVATGILYGGQS